MTRIKSFAAPHKALRNIISKFAFALGSEEISDPAQLKKLKQLGKEMFILLNNHVHTENEHTLKSLEERCRGASRHDLDDHKRLEEIQNSLQLQLRTISDHLSPDYLHDYYLKFTLFQSQYLEHIFEEETVTELLLHQYFTDDELIQQRNTIMKTMEFRILLLWMKYMVPAQQPEEGLAMLKGFRNTAPKEMFDQVMDIIRSEMNTGRFEDLRKRLDY